MKLQALQKDDYEIVEGPNKTVQQDAIKYIHRLSTITNTDIGEWDIIQVFGTGEGTTLHTDPNEINKRFFEHVETLPKQTVEKLVPPHVTVLLKQQSDRIRGQVISELKKNKESYMKNARSYLSNFDGQMMNWGREHRRFLELTQTLDDNNIDKELEKILRTGFWELWNFEFGQFVFVTKQELVLVHENTKAKINMQKNFGRFKVVIDMVTHHATCHSFHNNIGEENERIHPHVFAGGRICWGAVQTTGMKAFQEGRWADGMQLLASLLLEHNPNDVTYSLDIFDDTKRFGPKKPPVSPLKAMLDLPVEKAMAEVAMFVDEEIEQCGACERPVTECNCEAY